MTTLTANCIDLNIQGIACMPSSSNWQIWRFRMAMSPIAAFSCKRYCCAKSCIPPALARVLPSRTVGACIRQPFVLFARKSENVDWKASDGEDVNCWICLGVPQTGEDDQVKIIGTLCRKIIHQDFIDQLKQGDASQVLALLNQTLTS